MRQWAKGIKRETVALYLACRDPRVPWYAKVLGLCVVGYALSPVDLIPDPIPVLGYLDDVILVPVGLLLVRRMIPAVVMEECRAKAAEMEKRPVNWVAGVVVIVLWLMVAAAAGIWVWRCWD